MTYEYNYISLLFISQKISTFVLKWWGHHCWLVCAIFLPSNTNLIDINQTYHWIVIEYGSSVNNLTFLAMLRGWSTDAVWKHFANSLSTETWRHNPFLNGSQCTYMYGIRPALHKHGNLEFMNNITETHPPLLPHWYKSSVNESKGGVKGTFSPPKTGNMFDRIVKHIMIVHHNLICAVRSFVLWVSH